MPTFRNLMPIRTKGEKPPLFCVHGEPLQMAFRMSADRPIYGVCLLYDPDSGLEQQDPSLPASMEALAALYLQEIRQVQPQGPYYICAYSVGGLIAFEMVRQLIAAGEVIGNLMLVEPRGPDVVTAADNSQKISNALNYVKYADNRTAAIGAIVRKLMWTTGRRIAKKRDQFLTVLGRKTGAALNDVQRWMLLSAYIQPLLQVYSLGTLNCAVTMVNCDLNEESRNLLIEYWQPKFSGELNFVCLKDVYTHHELMTGVPLDQTIAMLDQSVA